MSTFSKILLFVSITTVAGSFGYVSYKQNEISDRQKQLESSLLLQKDLGDQITRSLSQYATSKDIEKMLKDNSVDVSKINKDMDSLKAKIDNVNSIVANSIGYDWQDVESTETKPIPESELSKTITTSCELDSGCIRDNWGYYKSEQILSLKEKFKDLEVPIGQVSFSAPKEKPWNVSIYSRDYKLITTSTVNEDQRVINYNSLKINVDGKDYSIPIIATTLQALPEYKFRWFAPQLFLGLDAGAITNGSLFFGPSINFGLMNYGMYKSQPDFSILQFGVAFDADDKVNYISITPAAYNIGKQLPFISNTYLGASINFSPQNGTSAITAGLRVGL